jgi:hypothetical protein
MIRLPHACRTSLAGDNSPMDASSVNQRPDDEPLCTVLLTLSESERIEFQKCAERCGLSLSQWMRDRLNEALRREAKES